MSRPVEESVPATPAVRNPTVLGIGFASHLSDTGHEMAIAAMPGFLTSLGAPAAAFGGDRGDRRRVAIRFQADRRRSRRPAGSNRA
jgi:hypothetical protein